MSICFSLLTSLYQTFFSQAGHSFTLRMINAEFKDKELIFRFDLQKRNFEFKAKKRLEDLVLLKKINWFSRFYLQLAIGMQV